MTLIPSREEIAKFRFPVRPIVLETVDRYEAFISADAAFGPAEFFVQPYLANYLPDLVISTPRGLLILDIFDGEVKTKEGADKFKVVCDKAKLVRDAFRELCFPATNELCAKLGLPNLRPPADGVVKSLINAAVVAPGSTTGAVRSIREKPHEIPAYGKATGPEFAPWPSVVEANRVPGEHREAVLRRCREVARSWLTPPFHRAEDGRIGQDFLSRAQRPHAVPRGAGWFRLQGPAGSGKSMVLAHKAAMLAAQGKNVLIIGYNITLRNYLQDLVNQMRYDFDWRRITIRHIHGLFKEVRLHFIAPSPGDPADGEHFFERAYPECAKRLLVAHARHRFRYDAILVDEGQDFSDAYFQVLAACLSEDGELLLVRDLDQNLYGKDSKWCETGGQSIHVGAGLRGFSGPWAKLPTTWRMSPAISKAVSEFAVRELRSESFNADEKRPPTLFDAAAFCRWENVSGVRMLERMNAVANDVAQQMKPTHPSDLTVLTYSNDRAWEAVVALRKAGIPAVHVYDSDGKRNRDKLFEFCRGDGRIKVCTGHSFKGFEVWGVIVLAERIGDRSQPHWLYTCMGRAIEGLWVLNADAGLDHVAEWFPQS